MTMNRIVKLAAIFLVASQASANEATLINLIEFPEYGFYGYGWCEVSYRHTSYGRGLQGGFTDRDLRPQLVDEGCYQLGVEEGQSLAARSIESPTCEVDFKQNFNRGLRGEVDYVGNECMSAGYLAGEAALEMGAREALVDVVGERCVDEYARGKTDARAFRMGTPRSSQPEMQCYMTGFDDGERFPNQ